MRRLRTLLKPGWLALAVVVAGFAYMCFTVLAPWQLDKNSSTEQRNDQINASFSAEPVELAEVVPGTEAPESTDEWRRVTVTGAYLTDDQVLARLRSVLGQPAYEVLTPFRVTEGVLTNQVVLVNRGFVRPIQGTQPPAITAPPSETVRLEARIRLDERPQPRPSFDDGGVRQIYGVNAGQVGEVTGLTVRPGYLQLGDNQPGVLEALPLPQLDAGPYLSYGLQWIAFGIMAPLGLGYFVWAELRERRDNKRRIDPAATPEPELSPQPQPAPEPVSTLADRYGKRR
ncbi:SURF1 family protein [Rhodococcus sp. X156]|uniref:SURF1 family cytochrome oxidase biogenesis protein n=1 Tax=Rhodococcus sp. X156 TaxID=2499145 RepID=UPI000FDA9E72|nr:SURF1 family protein [Rhodococcus sp. X156]